MHAIHSLLIKTHVTALRIHHEYILAGIGDELNIFSLITGKLLIRMKIFDGLRLFGIDLCLHVDNLLLHAENELKCITIDWNRFVVKENGHYRGTEWILKAKSLKENVVTVTVENVVELFDEDLRLLKRIRCDVSCLLLAARLCYDTWEDLIVFSGTMFSEILIWQPAHCDARMVAYTAACLKGHEGIIFSIDYKEGAPYIASTSDDKTTILWHIASGDALTEIQNGNVSIELKCILRGHIARVFNCKLSDRYLVSVGEDGVLNEWSFDGVLLKAHDLHQGGAIQCVDVDRERNLIVTGGFDSAITISHAHQPLRQHKLQMKPKLVPKRVVFLSNDHLIVVDEAGCVYHHAEHKWTVLGQFPELRSYALLEISDCRQKFALAGYFGHIFIFTLTNGELTATCCHQIATKSRIYSLHWLGCQHITTTTDAGSFQLWRLDGSRLVLVHSMELPKSKERWSTAAAFCDSYITVGDRKGNLYLFNLNDKQPTQIIKRAHNHLGVTKVIFMNRLVVTLGRNFKVKIYRIANEKLVNVSSDKLPFAWLTNYFRKDDKEFIIGFLGKSFVLWDHTLRRILFLNDCAGGHRSWDYKLTKNSFKFAYIKEKSIFLTDSKWNALCSTDVAVGISSYEINSLKSIKNMLIYGGEDTKLRISKYAPDFSNVKTLKSHLSNILSIHIDPINSDEYFMYSCGGRAQIILWHVTFNRNELLCDELYSYYEKLSDDDECEVRFRDMATYTINTRNFLLVACSDGKINVFERLNKQLVLLGYLQYTHKCILKMTIIEFCNYIVLLTMATDGALVFWNLSVCNFQADNQKKIDLKPFYSIIVQDLGVNCYSYRKYAQDSFIFLTGGDDNSFNLINFKFTRTDHDLLDVVLLSNLNNDRTHCAQIVGVHLSEKYIFTCARDQLFTVWEYDVERNEISTKYSKCHRIALPDVKGMCVYEDECAFNIYLYGWGMQILTINK